MRANQQNIPFEYAGAAKANKTTLAPKAPTHAALTIHNTHLELVHRVCRGRIKLE